MESSERRNDDIIVCILWSPAKHLWDRIINDLNTYCHDFIKIHKQFDLELNEDELEGFIAQVYCFDDIAPSVLEYKKKAILNCSKLSSNGTNVRIVKMKNFQSLETDSNLTNMLYNCKEKIRNTYKVEIMDYKRDVIIHMTDNCIQGGLLWEALISYFNTSQKRYM